VWSEWNQFTTARNEPAPFKFVYLGDPQNDIKEHVSRVFREAYKLAPDASFWLTAGDLATYPTDDLWGELFDAAGFIWRVTPSIMVPGNHDRSVVMVDGKETRLKTTDPIWKAHFTLPENGVAGLEETSYSIDYQGVRFLMLNTNDKLQEQAEWMEKLLSKNTNKWTIVALHYPFYNTGSDHDTKSVRIALLPIIDKYNVDLVLQGHDHTYARTFKLREGRVVPVDEKGTVFVVSVSGPKAYALNTQFKDLMAKIGEKISSFQVISVEANKLSFTAYTAAGAVYDSFELRK
jgi:3',5'-cyclic AMP phosphodiesterase CpdA